MLFRSLVLGDEPDGGAQLLEEKHMADLLAGIPCVVVQASYRSKLTDAAQVVLPATIWAEKTGTLTNFTGRMLPLRPVVPVRGAGRDDAAIVEAVYA